MQDFVHSTNKFNSIVGMRKPILCSARDGDPESSERNLSGKEFLSIDFLSLLSTPVTFRWTVPLNLRGELDPVRI